MLLTPREHEFLWTLLNHGGITSAALAGHLLNISVADARVLLCGLVDRGWLVCAPIKLLRGRTRYFQISRRTARYFEQPNCAAARYTQRDETALRGLVRFWFRTTFYDRKFSTGREEISAAFSFFGLQVPAHQSGTISEAICLNENRLEIYAFPPLDRTLYDYLKSTVIRYSSVLGRARLGFVIEARREPQLREILEAFGASAFPYEEEEKISQIERQLKEAESSIDRIKLERQLQELRSHMAQESDPKLGALFLSTVVHSMY